MLIPGPVYLDVATFKKLYLLSKDSSGEFFLRRYVNFFIF